jgi:hypothetical protein
LDFVVQAFQLSTHLSECHFNDASNILANDPTGLDLSNNPKHLRPEEAVIFRSLSLSCGREGLAGEATCEEVDLRLSACSNFSAWHVSRLYSFPLIELAVASNTCGVGSKPFGRETPDVAIYPHPLEVLA